MMHAWGAVDLRIYSAKKNHGYLLSVQSYGFCPHLIKLDILDFTLSHIPILTWILLSRVKLTGAILTPKKVPPCSIATKSGSAAKITPLAGSCPCFKLPRLLEQQINQIAGSRETTTLLMVDEWKENQV